MNINYQAVSSWREKLVGKFSKITPNSLAKGAWNAVYMLIASLDFLANLSELKSS
jgi:hypothetical protein